MKIEIEIPKGYFFDKETMSVIKKSEFEFEYVDLGLPSGTKWATCNVGAEKDTDFGNYLSFESAQKYNCPSKEQIEELFENTTSLWIVKNGVNGRLFIGKNGNYIFLPAAGYRIGENLLKDGLEGVYRSSNPYPYFADMSYYFCFYSDVVHPKCAGDNDSGLSVRPVSK